MMRRSARAIGAVLWAGLGAGSVQADAIVSEGYTQTAAGIAHTLRSDGVPMGGPDEMAFADFGASASAFSDPKADGFGHEITLTLDPSGPDLFAGPAASIPFTVDDTPSTYSIGGPFSADDPNPGILILDVIGESE